MQSPTVIRHRFDKGSFAQVITLLSKDGVHAYYQKYGISMRGTTVLDESIYFGSEMSAIEYFNEQYRG